MGQVKERVRDARAGAALEELRRDLSYGLRVLVKSPGFTAVAVATLALGIGANTAVFSVVDTVVFRPLPYREPDRLVKIWGLRRGHGREDLSLPDFSDIRRQNRVFEQVAADDGRSFRVTDPVELRESVDVASVTANWLPTLGVGPLIGRNFLEEEEQPGRDRVLILGNHYWRRRFDSDPNAIGKTVILDGEAFTVVGILPPNILRYDDEMLKPLVPAAYSQERSFRDLDVFARLKPGITLAQAQVEVETIAARLEQHYPATNKDRTVHLQPLDKYYAGFASSQGEANRALVLMLAAVGLVMLIACANVANLLLTRAVTRRRECVVRSALGAGRGRLIRQLLTESVLLFLLGGALGVLLARWSVDLLAALAVTGGYLPGHLAVALDSRVLLFGLLVSALTGLSFGLAPALQASSLNLTETLSDSSRALGGGIRRNRARRALVVGELALALLLLIGAGLFVRSFLRLQDVSPGFDPENLLATVGDKGRPFPGQVTFWRAVLDHARNLPGVESVAVTSRPPLHRVRALGFAIGGGASVREGEEPKAGDVFVSPDYFRTMRIPLLKGRPFTDQDTQSAPPVAIISQSLARRYFRDEEPLGRRLRVHPEPTLCCGGSVAGGWVEVVGVVGDVRQGDLDEEPAVTLYRPYSQIVEHDMFLMVRARSSSDFSGLVTGLRPQLLAVDREIEWSSWDGRTATSVDAMRQVVRGSESLRRRRFVLILLGVFAALALVLAAVGIYGVTAYSVAERTREIGIRMALGATRHLVLKQVLAEAITLVLSGLILGMLSAQVLTRLISTMLFGVGSTDAVTYLGVSFLFAGVVLLATYLPARRAMQVDPMTALRHE